MEIFQIRSRNSRSSRHHGLRTLRSGVRQGAPLRFDRLRGASRP